MKVILKVMLRKIVKPKTAYVLLLSVLIDGFLQDENTTHEILRELECIHDRKSTK